MLTLSVSIELSCSVMKSHTIFELSVTRAHGTDAALAVSNEESLSDIISLHVFVL